jgi:UDP-N-acetyl-D-glucosamine dehydrogenase
MEKLEALGAHVAYHDPHVPIIRPSRRHHALTGRRSVPLSENYDLMILVTPHAVFSELNLAHWKIPVIDTRNALRVKPAKYYRA